MTQENTGNDGVVGKGRATPSRREAEAARKKQMKTPTSRKEQVKRDRAKRDEYRRKQQQALRTGEEKYLPARERGPVRRFLRDYVDRRWNVAEFLLPAFILVLVLPALGATWANQILPLIIVATGVDFYLLLRGARRQLAARGFDLAEVRGYRFYAILRCTQLRFMRLPKPQVKRGQPLADHYR